MSPPSEFGTSIPRSRFVLVQRGEAGRRTEPGQVRARCGPGAEGRGGAEWSQRLPSLLRGGPGAHGAPSSRDEVWPLGFPSHLPDVPGTPPLQTASLGKSPGQRRSLFLGNGAQAAASRGAPPTGQQVWRASQPPLLAVIPGGSGRGSAAPRRPLGAGRGGGCPWLPQAVICRGGCRFAPSTSRVSPCHPF